MTNDEKRFKRSSTKAQRVSMSIIAKGVFDFWKIGSNHLSKLVEQVLIWPLDYFEEVCKFSYVLESLCWLELGLSLKIFVEMTLYDKVLWE